MEFTKFDNWMLRITLAALTASVTAFTVFIVWNMVVPVQ